MECLLFCVQTVVTLESGKLMQKQTWDGKETTLEREVTDGKLIAVRALFEPRGRFQTLHVLPAYLFTLFNLTN